MFPRLFGAPANLPADTRHNWKATQKEGVAFGPTDAASSFLPVLLARLGASNVEVGLLSAIPNFAGFLLAVPVGHFLQSRRNALPFYSRGRFINQLTLAAIGLSLVAVPLDRVVPVILVIIGLGAIVGSFANFSFYTVMDGLSGPNGRYELMGRRWGIKGGSVAISLAVIGWILGALPFPLNYQVVMIGTAAAAVIGFRYSRTFRIPDNVRRPQPTQAGVLRAGASVRDLLGERRFLAFLFRHAVFMFGLTMAVPLIPLYYVRVLGVNDAWIGLIGTTQAVLTMAGYFLWRGPARRRGGTWVLVPSTIGCAAFPALLAITQHELVVAVIVGVYGICLAGLDLALFDELMKSIPADQAIRFAALDTGASNFSGMSGPIAGAVLASAVGIPGGLMAAGAVSFVGAALFVMTALSRRKGEPAVVDRVGPPAESLAEPGGDR